MKKKHQRLSPINAISKTQASYQKLMLEMMSKLVHQTKENNQLIRGHHKKASNTPMNQTQSTFKDNNNLPFRVTTQEWNQVAKSPDRQSPNTKVTEVYQSHSRNNIRPKPLKQSHSVPTIDKEQLNCSEELELSIQGSKIEMILQSLEQRLKSGEEVNRKLLDRIQKMQKDNKKRGSKIVSSTEVQSSKEHELSFIEKAIKNKYKIGNDDKKNSYTILADILPYSDRRQIKVRFRIQDIFQISQQTGHEDLQQKTAEWLGNVYRATASICWNMLLNNYLSFDQIKILFTQNIIFNFIEFMKEVQKTGNPQLLGQVTSCVNSKSVKVLQFLCRQYPQTKIEAPNLALRSILPQIDNQGRSKYDLVCKSSIVFTYKQNGDYTAQIMKMINFMIQRSNQEFEGFFDYMRQTFQEVHLPINKRRNVESTGLNKQRQMTHDDLKYRDKVKGYTKYLIGRKIPKNTLPYSQQEIDDGIFFVKSNAVLRIITKWVEELKEYFEDPDKRIKNNYNQNKDHHGNIMYLSALLKNGIHKQILKERACLKQKVDKIKKQCQKMEHLLTAEQFTSDPSQVILSQEQISVGMYCCNIKSVISSYICSELNKLIHFLLSVPRNVSQDSLGNDLQVFQSQARKELDSVNLITFKLSDLLRCKIHSNQQEIIWIVQYLIAQSKYNRDRFKIVRIKDRLAMGTRDIMINGQINRGLTCQIQLSVTSNSDRKQQLLDSYNHFLYELKRSELGSITQNVSIWSNLEQRYSYFEQINSKKSKLRTFKQNQQPLKHQCGTQSMKVFKRPLICKECRKFYPIPKTCLLNVICHSCHQTYCGQCYYYNYLTPQGRKEFIFDNHRLIKSDVMDRLIEYTDYTKPLPTTGIFIKKDFLTKELSFYMAIERNKQENVKDNPKIQILITQTIVKNGRIFNRQVNKKQIEARLQKGQFYIKDYEQTELNNFIIFYFDKKETKKMMYLTDLRTQLEKPQNSKAKVLNILREPSYIHNLHLLKKQNQKIKELNSLSSAIGQGKVIVYIFNNFYILAQVFVKGSLLRADIRKRINLNELKAFGQKENDIVSMEYKYVTTQMEDIATKMKPKLYSSFCKNLKKLFLSHGNISSIKCFKNFKSLETIFISQNNLTSLEGIEKLQSLMSVNFDKNQVEDLMPFSQLKSMRYISGNSNKLKSLKGLEDLHQLRSLSLYQNQIQSIQQIRNAACLEELTVRDNPITDLQTVQTLSKLVKLYIGKTKVVNLPDLSMLKNLKNLSLESLNLTTVPTIFSSLALHELSLSNNKIQDFSILNKQTELVYVSLSHNNIESISHIQNMDKLETLKLNHNKITTVRGVKNLDSLRHLYLKNNPINQLGELDSYEISFKYYFTHQTLTVLAINQLKDLEALQNNLSSTED